MPLWLWTLAGAAIGLVDFSLLLVFDANLTIAGRDATIPLFFLFVVPYGLLGWLVGGLAEARRRERRDRETIERQLAELARSQRRLVQEEKLAGIGRLAAGVAHEVRNPLGVIRASASMAQESFESASDPYRALGFVCEETDRLDRLIQSLLTFAKPQAIECVETDVTKVIDRAVELARAEAREHAVALEVDVAPGLPTLWADPDRLSQALYGLTLNAIQALAASQAADAEPGSAPTPRVVIRAGSDGDVMRLEVSDTGPGIPLAMREQVFEPFVTTRDTGTGLGLPMALRMIEAQGGALALAPPAAEGGACFRIEFPLSPARTGLAGDRP